MNINDVKNTLIREAKPIIEHCFNKSNPVERIVLQYFDQRIKTLSDKDLKEVFDSFLKLKEQYEKDRNNLEAVWVQFYLKLCWSYQNDNKWY